MRIRVTALAAAMAIVAALPGATPAHADTVYCAPDDIICLQLVQAQSDQAAAQDKLAQIQNQIQDVGRRMQALNNYIQSLNFEILRQQAMITETQGRIDELDGKIRATEADIARRQAHLQVREALFGQRVRSMDKRGSVNYLALVLSATSFNQLVDRVLMAQQVIHADRRLIDDLHTEKERIQGLKDQLAAQRAQQADLLVQAQAQKAALEQTRQQQQAAYAYLAQLEQQYRAQAEEMARAIAVISDQVNMLTLAYQAEIAAAGGGTGRFLWPMSPHLLSQGFGCSPYVFEVYWPACPTKHFHTGIDIAEPFGNTIYAADSGVIAVYRTCCGYGTYAVISHGNGYASVYGHMSGFGAGIHTGQIVYRGQVIGYEGSTGNSTGPHLHFEIRYNGSYVDPCAYLGC